MTTTNFYYAILIAVGVGVTIFMVVVTLTHDDIFGQTVEEKVNSQGAGVLERMSEECEITDPDKETDSTMVDCMQRINEEESKNLCDRVKNSTTGTAIGQAILESQCK